MQINRGPASKESRVLGVPSLKDKNFSVLQIVNTLKVIRYMIGKDRNFLSKINFSLQMGRFFFPREKF